MSDFAMVLLFNFRKTFYFGPSMKKYNISPGFYLKKSLGGQWLFSTLYRQNAAPFICLRHDVDGIMWQPTNGELSIGAESWKHVATLDAFGYVLASKREHKFVRCGANFEHAVISDCQSNLYVYECGKAKQRKRSQFVACFPDSKEILGCVVSKDWIYVLTDSQMHLLSTQTE